MVKRLLIVILFFSSAVFANISIEVDRQKVLSNDTFTLNISLQDIDFDELDLTPLEQDFFIVGRSEQRSLSIINTKRSSQNLMLLTLKAKNIGKVAIPSLKAGNFQSTPLSIEVLDAEINKTQNPVFITAQVDKKQVLIQSQLIYTITLYSNQPLQSSTLPFTTTIDDALVETLKPSASKRATYQGKSYWATTYRFAIFPQKRGELFIPEVNLPINLRNGNRNQSLKLYTKGISVEVLPQPNNININPWLAAADVSLAETYQNTPTFTVGEPITREITLRAQALSPVQLPDITITEIDAFQQYADKTDSRKTIDETSITSFKTQQFVIIPNYAGEFTLPEVRIDWYNTRTNQLETAFLPAQTVNVRLGTGNNNTANNTPATLIDDKPNINNGNTPQVQTTTNHQQESNLSWQIISAILFILWLVTLVWWCLSARKKRIIQQKITVNTPNLNALKQQINRACAQNNATQTRQLLIVWANTAIDENITGLTTLAENAQFISIAPALKQLDSVLYQMGEGSWHGKAFWLQVKPLLNTTKKNQQDTGLKSLYPD